MGGSPNHGDCCARILGWSCWIAQIGCIEPLEARQTSTRSTPTLIACGSQRELAEPGLLVNRVLHSEVPNGRRHCGSSADQVLVSDWKRRGLEHLFLLDTSGSRAVRDWTLAFSAVATMGTLWNDTMTRFMNIFSLHCRSYYFFTDSSGRCLESFQPFSLCDDMIRYPLALSSHLICP